MVLWFDSARLYLRQPPNSSMPSASVECLLRPDNRSVRDILSTTLRRPLSQASAMAAIPEHMFIDTVRQTVNGLIPRGYLDEAKYLLDSIVAARGVPFVKAMRDILPNRSIRKLGDTPGYY